MATKPKIQRGYPQVSAVKDLPTQQSLRLLWDRIYGHDETNTANAAALASAQATIDSQSKLINTLNTQVTKLLPAQGTDQTNTANGTLPQPGGGGGGNQPPPPPTGGDGGQGNLGCSEAGANGHLDPGYPITPESCGKIICGTGNEFPALLAIAVDQPTRDANQSELLDRMVWHMNLAGFPCSRYPTTNGRPWILLFNVGADQYAYRVIDYAAGNFTVPYTTLMVFAGRTPNSTTTPDGGTPD